MDIGMHMEVGLAIRQRSVLLLSSFVLKRALILTFTISIFMYDIICDSELRF